MNIKQKILAWIISSLLIIASVSLYFHYRMMINEETIKLESLADILSSAIEFSASKSMFERNADTLENTFRDFKVIKQVSNIWLVNNDGVIKAGTGRELVGTRMVPEDVQRSGFLKDEGTFRWVHLIKNRSECHSCHRPKEKYNGSIVLDFFYLPIKNQTKMHILKESLVILVSFLIIGVVLIVVSNSIVIKRLNAMISKIKRSKDGEHNIRSPLEGDDEITRLEESFNELTDAIYSKDREKDGLFVKLKASNEQLLVEIENRRLAEESLKESEEIFRTIFESAHDGILVADTEAKKFHMGNMTICRMLGYDKEELKNIGVTDIHPEEDIPVIIEKFAQIVRKELVLTKGIRVKRKDGGIFYADIGASPVAMKGKDYVIGIFRDITEQQKAEEEKKRLFLELQDAFDKISLSQKEWQDTFDSITDLVSIHDKEFNIIRYNRAFAEHFGIDCNAKVNKKCYELFHDTCSPVSNCPHKQMLHTIKSTTEEVHDPKSKRTFKVSIYPFHAPNRDLIGSIHVVRDITEEREKEMRLIMSERLAALGQMASGIAHEINNPLASIAGCTSGLLNRLERFEPELFKKYLSIIEEEILRCKGITTSMLSFVRQTTYETKRININEAIDKTLDIISFQGRLDEVKVIKNCFDPMPLIHVNEGEIRQVLIAVIINAIDAMQDNGTLIIETGTIPQFLPLEKSGENGIVFIKISDTGPGISPEHIDSIFKPFFTTKSEEGGTGLGLSIAQRIISTHNGDINVTSETGKGTTFTISLPL